MAAKGRRNIPNIGFVDTVPAGSALQAVLIAQDSGIDQLNNMLSYLETFAEAVSAAAAVSDVATAATALETSLDGLSPLSKAVLK